jgi:ribosomal protein S28E/S33
MPLTITGWQPRQGEVKHKTILGETMKEIALTKAKVAIVDDEDYDRIINSGFSWVANGCAGYISAVGLRKVNGKNTSAIMARFILGVTDKGIEVDHINGDTLNNRRENLRLATPRQNRFNRRKQVISSNPYKGISFDKKKKKWAAKIKRDGKLHWLGRFRTPEEAARAYDKAAVELFGEFARLNFA